MTLIAERPLDVTTLVREPASLRQDLLVTVFGVLMLTGYYLDSWAHKFVLKGFEASQDESFFTPWHGVLYAGAFGLMAIVWSAVLQLRATGRRGLDGVPYGWGWALVGSLVVVLGAPADMAWHQLVGFETGIQVQISPPHQIVFIGGLLLATGPLRALIGRSTAAKAPLRAIVAVGLAATILGLPFGNFVIYRHPWVFSAETWQAWDALAPAGSPGHAAELLQSALPKSAWAMQTVTTLVILGAILLLRRRWSWQRGTAALVCGMVAVINSIPFQFERPMVVVAALVSAGWIEVAAARLLDRTEPAWLAFATAFTLLLWLPFFAAVSMTDGVGAPLTTWVGFTTATVIAAVGVTWLVAQVPAPARS